MWLDHSLNPFVDMSVYYHGKAAVDLADLEGEPCWLGFADGGHVSGPGTATSDSIFARVSNGEFIVNAAAASKHGKLLEAINSGKVPRFADGGIVGGGLVTSIANLAQAAVTGQTAKGRSTTISGRSIRRSTFTPRTRTACGDRPLKSPPRSVTRPLKSPRVGVKPSRRAFRFAQVCSPEATHRPHQRA